jgi:hypothetical protein
MKTCVRIAWLSVYVFGGIAVILVILGVIAFMLKEINGSMLFNVKRYFTYLLASLPFSLLAIYSAMFVMIVRDK